MYETDPQRYATIKKLLDAELIDWPGRMGPGTEGLTYVKRYVPIIFRVQILEESYFQSARISLHFLGADRHRSQIREAVEFFSAYGKGSL